MGDNMDNTIKNFPTQAEAQAYCDQQFATQMTEAIAAGYTVINNAIVGKTNGIDDLSAQQTTKWGNVFSETNGTFSAGGSIFPPVINSLI